MDNKKWYKRLNTVFWWVLACLPLIEWLFYLIMKVVNLNTQGGTPLSDVNLFYYFTQGDNGFGMFLDTSYFMYNFTDLIPQPLLNCFTSLFDLLGVENYYIANFFAWFVSIHFFHLIVDVFVWLPNMLHKLMDKYQD